MKQFLIIALLSLFILGGCSRQNDCQSYHNLTERNDCYKQLAITAKDVSVCEKMQPELQEDGSGVPTILIRMDCYDQIAVLTRNASLCSMYARYNSVSICTRNVAVAENDSSACDGLTIEQDLCYYRIAVLKSDADECGKISDSLYKDKCLKEIAGGEKFYCDSYGC